MTPRRTALNLAIAAAVLATSQAVAVGATGFSMSPSIAQTTAAPGASTSVTISNSTGKPLKVAVRARAWSQARSGTVAANRTKRLGGVTLSASSFTLATGTKRTVSVRLNGMPAAKSLFGALEVVGRPVKTSKGINVAYRLIPSLRFNPSSGARRLSLSAGGAKVASRSVVLPVRNGGNTIDPVSGSVSVSGAGAGRSSALRSVRILPGKTVNFDLTARRGLRAGSYTAAVTLRQGGKTTKVSRRFRIR
jgi:hypothetical protein